MSVTGRAAAAVRLELDRSPVQHRHELCAQNAIGTTLEQKYVLLADSTRAVLRRLAVFAGEFTLDSASVVVAYDGVRKSEVAPSLATLHESSLVELRGEGTLARYRLTRQIRAFALAQLVSEGEWDLTARQHAQHLQHLFEYAEVELDRGVVAQWMASYERLMDDVRGALDWAFSPSGDDTIGVGLTVAALPLWVLCSRTEELCRRIDLALSSQAAVTRSPREMQLRIAARLAGMGSLME